MDALALVLALLGLDSGTDDDPPRGQNPIGG